MVQGWTPMYRVCLNESSELLKLLLEANLVNQDMMKNADRDVRMASFMAIADTEVRIVSK